MSIKLPDMPLQAKASLLRCRKLIAIGWHTIPASPHNRNDVGATEFARLFILIRNETRMNVTQLRISRRSIALAVALFGMVSLAIGAHAALNKRALDAAKAIATEQSEDASRNTSRIALVIGNGHYPDANAPLTQPINDARALTAALRRNAFDVDVVEDASKDDMHRAVGRLKSKVKPDS